ncbi:hypothetical protein FQR65_LT00494 [Abscondita terminalis]|nr:hypothetical protein FQR65_LT00494 [Abscondita terminalis]
MIKRYLLNYYRPKTGIYSNMRFSGRRLQYFAFIGGAFNVLLCGLHIGWTSSFLPQLLSSGSKILVTNDEGSWIASMFLIGGIFGSILSALILDVIGRKKVIVLTGIILLPSWLLTVFATTCWELLLARFIAGISDGCTVCSVSLYFAEIGHVDIRGFLISALSALYFVGVFLMNLLGYYYSMKVVGVTCSVITLVGILACLRLPESPYLFIIKDEPAKARSVLQKLYGTTDVEEPLRSMRKTFETQRQRSGKWQQLFTDVKNRHNLLLVNGLTLVQQCNGILGITFYFQTLFDKVIERATPTLFIAIYFLLQILTSIVNSAIIDKVGRRPLLLVSTVVVITALFIVSLYFTLQGVTQIDVTKYYWIPIIGFFLFIVGYTLGLHSIPILFASELFPLHVKPLAICIINIFFAGSATAVSKFFQFTKDEYGEYVPFIAFTVCSLGGLVFVYYYVPETKRKTLEEIQTEKKFNNNLSSFNVLLCGLHFGWTSPFLPQLLNSNSTISVTNDEGSWIASTYLIGGICGSILAALIFDVIGRKKLLVLTGVIFIPSWLMIAFATTGWEIMLARFIAGVADGLTYCCVPLFYGEIGDAKIRGFLISGIAVIYFIVCLSVPESPHFLMVKGETANARIALQRFYGRDDVEEPLKLIAKTLDEVNLHKGRSCNCLLIECNGILGITFYVQTLFEDAVQGALPIAFISIYFVLQILTSIANAGIVDRVGRRPLLFTSLVTLIIALFIVSAYFTVQGLTRIDVTNYYWFPIGGFFLFIVGYTIGLHNVPIILGGELFPLHVKALAYTKDEFGEYVPFIMFTICTLCGLPFVYYCVPETKKKTLEEIQMQIRSSK